MRKVPNPYKRGPVIPWWRSGVTHTSVAAFGLAVNATVQGVMGRLPASASLRDLVGAVYLSEWWSMLGALAVCVYAIGFNQQSVTPPGRMKP